jgi:hypothetical protein
MSKFADKDPRQEGGNSSPGFSNSGLSSADRERHKNVADAMRVDRARSFFPCECKDKGGTFHLNQADFYGGWRLEQESALPPRVGFATRSDSRSAPAGNGSWE